MLGGRLPVASASSSLDADDILAGSKEKQSTQTTASLTGAGVKTARGLWLGGLVIIRPSTEGSLPIHTQFPGSSTINRNIRSRGRREGSHSVSDGPDSQNGHISKAVHKVPKQRRTGGCA